MTTDWISQFVGLARLETSIKDILVRKSSVVSIPAGSVIFGPGKSPENLLLLLAGRVRVQQVWLSCWLPLMAWVAEPPVSPP